jgi:hypothetical protein
MDMGLVAPRRARARAASNRRAFFGEARRWAVSIKLSYSSAAIRMTSSPFLRRTRIGSRSETVRSQNDFKFWRSREKDVSIFATRHCTTILYMSVRGLSILAESLTNCSGPTTKDKGAMTKDKTHAA